VATYYTDLYGPDTPLAIIEFFEEELQHLANDSAVFFNERYRFHYGEPLTGRAWGDHDEGYVSMSNGEAPVPIVLYNRQSTGGPAILMSNIIKIEATLGKRTIYRHPRFHTHDEVPPPVVESVDNRAPRRISLARNEQGKT